MSFNVPNTFVGQATLSASELDENFDEIVAIIDGGLASANLDTAAGITNGQLATSKFRKTISFRVTQAQYAAATAGDIIAFEPIDSLTWTAIKYKWACTDVGSQTTQLSVQFGSYTGALNVWATTAPTTVVAAQTLTSSAGADTPSSAGAAVTVACTGSDSVVYGLGLKLVVKDGTMMSAADDILVFVVELEHQLV